MRLSRSDHQHGCYLPLGWLSGHPLPADRSRTLMHSGPEIQHNWCYGLLQPCEFSQIFQSNLAFLKSQHQLTVLRDQPQTQDFFELLARLLDASGFQSLFVYAAHPSAVFLALFAEGLRAIKA